MRENIRLKLENNFWPQYRDADEDGYIGIKGYMNYFQDITSHHIFDMEFGNKHIYPKHDKIWVATKYKLHVLKKIEFTNSNITAKTWIEKSSSPVVINQMYCIYKENELYAYGKLEMCLIDYTTQKLSKLSEIEFGEQYMISSEDIPSVKFNKINDKGFDEEFVCTHIVNHTDLDSSKHMNNLSYVSMFLNALTPNEYNENAFNEFSINYINQSYYGDEINIYKIQKETETILIAKKEKDLVVAKCVFSTI